MEKKKITVTIKDKDGKVLLEYSEPVEISRGAMENITWIKKGVWTIKELLNINISKELSKAREEGRKELIKEIRESVKENIKIDDTEEKHIKIDTDIVKILNDKEITKMFLDGEWGDYVDSDCRVSWGWYS